MIYHLKFCGSRKRVCIAFLENYRMKGGRLYFQLVINECRLCPALPSSTSWGRCLLSLTPAGVFSFLQGVYVSSLNCLLSLSAQDGTTFSQTHAEKALCLKLPLFKEKPELQRTFWFFSNAVKTTSLSCTDHWPYCGFIQDPTGQMRNFWLFGDFWQKQVKG